MTLSFNRSGQYKILQLSNPWTDISSCLRRLDGVIAVEQPDLTVVSGEPPLTEQGTTALRRFCAFMEGYPAKWVLVSGSFETETAPGPLEDILSATPCCLYERERGDVGGGNFEIRLFGTDGKICWALYFFDTGGSVRSSRGDGRAYLDHSQVEWYVAKRMTTYAEEETFASIVFLHKALPEHLEACLLRDPQDGAIRAELGRLRNAGLFSALHEDKRALGVFCGTCLGRVVCFERQGITLASCPPACCSRASASGGYRIVLLNESGDRPCLDTYIRLWDGTVRRETVPFCNRPIGEVGNHG